MRRILLYISLAVLVFWGCHKKSSVVIPPATAPAPAEAAPPAVTPPSIPPPTAPLESAPIPKTITAPSNLELGEMNFQIGNYVQAAKAYEAVVNNPKSKNRDLAYYKLGLSRALANDRDLRPSEVAFRRLVSEYPDSTYKAPAEFILGLLSQIDRLRSDVKDRDDRIKKLSEELQVLKEIDLQRRPSRPKE